MMLSYVHLQSLLPHPPQRTGEARAEEAAGLMLQRASFLDEHVWPSPAYLVLDRRFLNVNESARGGGVRLPDPCGQESPSPNIS